MNISYEPPVSRLLELGEDPARAREWPDYLALGLGPEHVPELIRMATDRALWNLDSEDARVWATLHAWRALGQLRSEEAIEPLLTLLPRAEDDDWVIEEVPKVYGMIGPAALPALTEYLNDSSRDEWPRVIASSAIEQIGNAHPEARVQAVSILTDALRRYRQETELNAFIVSDLIDLRAVESVDVIRAAYEKDLIDAGIPGDLEEVEIALGVRAERSTRPPRYNLLGGQGLEKEALAAWEARWRTAGRNDACPCGSGKKFKKCCLSKPPAQSRGE